MTVTMIRAFAEPDRDAVVELWQRCDLTRPWNHPHHDIDRKLAVDPEGLLVADDGGKIVATVMVGYDGHRGWINYLAVDPDGQGGGLGARMMSAAEELLAARGCPKVNLQVRTSNAAAVAFYEAIGYLPDDVVSYGRRLVDDAAEGALPPPVG
jgi:ribosomal protein S18 acetylase RimI-like enzyme